MHLYYIAPCSEISKTLGREARGTCQGERTEAGSEPHPRWERHHFQRWGFPTKCRRIQVRQVHHQLVGLKRPNSHLFPTSEEQVASVLSAGWAAGYISSSERARGRTRRWSYLPGFPGSRPIPTVWFPPLQQFCEPYNILIVHFLHLDLPGLVSIAKNQDP